MTRNADNRTTKLREKLTERGIEYAANDHMGVCETSWDGFTAMQLTPGAKLMMVFTPEQAIAATLGRPKAKAHPYGYEPDTGAFDTTRCECGCLNDISATYCNDCGGEIEIDMNAEKEIYHTPRHLVFAEKHDDGSLEFGGERYIAATLGRPKVKKVRGTWWGPNGEEYDGLACSGCGEWIDGDLDCIGEADGPNFCHNCGGEFDGPMLCKVCGKLADMEFGDMCAECYWAEGEGNDER